MQLPYSLKHLKGKKIILGSGSPRRSELLSGLGLQFEIRISDVDETVPEHISTSGYANYLSELKSEALLRNLQLDEILVTADTIVTIDNIILNKPKSKQEAFEMLSILAGKEHQVITGITCATTKGKISISDTAKVRVIAMDEHEIEHYITMFEPMDKAGAYGIQEWFGLAMIDSIAGSYYTIMGLPTHQLYDILKYKIQSIL